MKLCSSLLVFGEITASPDDLPNESSNIDEREKIAREVTGIEK